MHWTAEQDRALSHVAKWLQDPHADQVFRLFGFAGTGKTTLARHITEDVPGRVLFAAPTGKAAHVLTTKGCPAQTAHSLIYRPKDRSTATLRSLENHLVELTEKLCKEHGVEPSHELVDKHVGVQELRRRIRAESDNAKRPMFSLRDDSPLDGARLLVLDEASMVDESLGADLASFGVKILCLGDPFQLPPVAGAGYFTNGAEPDVMLTDVQRAARDNPIIEISRRIREERRVPPLGRYGPNQVINRAQLTPDAAMAADMRLVGRNMTRLATNRRVRQLLGMEGWMPRSSDKVVCLRNNNELGLLNGSIWTVDEAGPPLDERVSLSVSPEDGGSPQVVEAHTHYFEGRANDLKWYVKKEAEEFDYGYALTVHKSQGSQWDTVMLFDESEAFRDMRWRWLYTGVTRTAQALTLVVD